ncbi:Protein arginine N-methyltransferase [Macleaya cordata]|uniref:Protein arginine N-methyltransferase n=1 Tax=Macleaya cordata TaxID=56857 RepID=A0A200R777_MACCD|nr:Protein arginine N-methyltransferase [Macleaya cordata]
MAENFNVNAVNEESEEEEFEQQLEDWEEWKSDEEFADPDFICLFCDGKYSSIESVFDHCSSNHSFDFQSIKKTLKLNFYDSFKLINYVRSQVAENRCWSCRLSFQSHDDLQKHLHKPINLENEKQFWEDDKYLNPFMKEDSLLHNFWEDEDKEEEDYNMSVDKEELMMELENNQDLEMNGLDEEDSMDVVPSRPSCSNDNGSKVECLESNSTLNMVRSLEKVTINGTESKDIGSSNRKEKGKLGRVSFANVLAKEIKNVNENYFGAYGSFGIHREMISDKVRMDAYRGAILNNPSLMNHATVLDVGCGTGILSLFAAQAGASRVIAVEASDKMAAVATQIAKDNGQLYDGSPSVGSEHSTGVISVVQGMVEEIDKSVQIPPHSVDVLLSEWMGYCLLYETMLSSVLYARDRWLKPGGAILPDTATIFVAGFGKGGTSIPFWENVYGFNMSCISKEVVEDASQNPIVDVVDSRDIMTNTVVVQAFDLATMKPDEMDFTSSFELEPRLDLSVTDLKSKTVWCYGVVLWFETGFSSRFCKEMPTVLSTSPYTPKTHWSQTIFTFREPIAMALEKPEADGMVTIGTDAYPAVRIQSRISIVRAAEHRSIDISLETSGISADGRKRNWPVQIFNL